MDNRGASSIYFEFEKLSVRQFGLDLFGRSVFTTMAGIDPWSDRSVFFGWFKVMGLDNVIFLVTVNIDSIHTFYP